MKQTLANVQRFPQFVRLHNKFLLHAKEVRERISAKSGKNLSGKGGAELQKIKRVNSSIDEEIEVELEETSAEPATKRVRIG